MAEVLVTVGLILVAAVLVGFALVMLECMLDLFEFSSLSLGDIGAVITMGALILILGIGGMGLAGLAVITALA